jgi:lysozyme
MGKMIRRHKILIIGLLILAAGIYWLFNSLGPFAYGIRMPKGYELHGIDVSRYQAQIDWASLEKLEDGKSKVRISFAYIKATEGRSIKDPQFMDNWSKIGKTGLLRGAYHFFIPTRSAEEQASNFIKCVALKKGDLPPMLDVEKLGNQGAAKLRENMKTWLKLVEKQYGMKPIIYSYIDFYERYLADDEELAKYPLWIASYHKRKLRLKKPWLFWQHSDRGQVEGIAEPVDFNVFNGSFDELKKLCKQ